MAEGAFESAAAEAAPQLGIEGDNQQHLLVGGIGLDLLTIKKIIVNTTHTHTHTHR